MPIVETKVCLALIDSLNKPVIIVSKERIVFANKKAIDFIGYTSSELASKPFTYFIHPDDRSLVYERYKKRIKDEKAPDVYEFRVITKKSEVKYVRLRASKTIYEGIESTINILTDLTEQKELESKNLEYKKGISILIELATNLIEALNEKELYTIIADKLSELTNNSIISILSYDEKTSKLRLERLSGINSVIQSILRVFDLDRMNKWTLNMSTKMKKQVMSNKLVHVKGGLYEASLKQMSKKDSKKYEQLLKIKNIYAKGLLRQGRLYGLAIIVSKESKQPNEELIESLSTISSIALYKRELFDKLEHSEEKCRTIFDNAGDSMFLSDLKGNILDVNNIAINKLGYSLEELKKMNLSKIDKPKYAKLIKTRVNDIIKNGQATFESIHVTKEGNEIPVEVNAKPIRFNSTDAILGIARDLSVRKKLTEELITSEEKYRLIVNNAAEGLINIDTKGNFIEANPRFYEITGTTKEEVIGKNLLQVAKLGRLNSIELLKAIKKALNTKKIIRTELTILRRDGKKVIISAYPSFIKKDGKITGFSILIEDVTELKAMQKIKAESYAKKELDNLRSEFLMRISHQLKQSLMPLIGYSRILEKEVERKEHLEYLNMIIESAYEMNESISKLLNLMRLERGELGFNLETIELSELVNEVLKYKSSGIKLRNIHVKTDLKKAKIKGDYERLKDVAINLIDNAIKFSKEGGTIEVRTGTKLNKAYLYVKDYGVGIKKEDLPNLFKTFYQTNEGVKVGGFGVGLALIKNIIEKHNGSINVKSEYGKNTEFRVILPRK